MNFKNLQNTFANLSIMPQGVGTSTSTICKTHLQSIVTCYKDYA